MTHPNCIHLYAELLLNIKSVSLFGSIDSDSPPEKSTQAHLVTDGSHITLSHESQTASLHLPVRTIGSASASLTLPAHCPKHLTSRLQLDGGNIAELLTLQEQSGNHVPWSASTLSAASSLHCRSCNVEMVQATSVRDWKDLPSENWPEMSDFWHCHKPPDHVSRGSETSGATEQNTAIPDLRPRPGSAFIDATSFHLSPQNCSNITVGSVLCYRHRTCTTRHAVSDSLQYANPSCVLFSYNSRALRKAA